VLSIKYISPSSSTLGLLSYRNTITLGSIFRGYPLLCFRGIVRGIMPVSP
jgi:hypothetical protein